MMKHVRGLVLVLAAMGLAACSRGPKVVPPEQMLVETTWAVHRLRGEPVALRRDEQRPYFQLDPKEGWMAGFTGCNRMFGPYTLEGERLWFGAIGATKMACVETMDLERVFTEALQVTARWRIEEGVLVLSDENGGELMRLWETKIEQRPGEGR